jgi:hypothetical protein
VKESIISEIRVKVIEQEGYHGSNTDDWHRQPFHGWIHTLWREFGKVGLRFSDKAARRSQLIDLAGVCASWAEAMDASDGDAA